MVVIKPIEVVTDYNEGSGRDLFDELPPRVAWGVVRDKVLRLAWKADGLVPKKR
jgi:hypothetical protein